MFTSLTNCATAAATVLALALTVSVVQVDTAAARGKATIELESVGGIHRAKRAKPRIAPGYTGRTVCCHLRRKNLLGIVTPAQCKKAKGKIVPRKKCAQAGAKASDAYFVKVDSETTTPN